MKKFSLIPTPSPKNDLDSVSLGKTIRNACEFICGEYPPKTRKKYNGCQIPYPLFDNLVAILGCTSNLDDIPDADPTVQALIIVMISIQGMTMFGGVTNDEFMVIANDSVSEFLRDSGYSMKQSALATQLDSFKVRGIDRLKFFFADTQKRFIIMKMVVQAAPTGSLMESFFNQILCVLRTDPITELLIRNYIQTLEAHLVEDVQQPHQQTKAVAK
eukprot:Filipodium_phascolosomae@DN2604_c0_g1_i1.p1